MVIAVSNHCYDGFWDPINRVLVYWNAQNFMWDVCLETYEYTVGLEYSSSKESDQKIKNILGVDQQQNMIYDRKNKRYRFSIPNEGIGYEYIWTDTMTNGHCVPSAHCSYVWIELDNSSNDMLNLVFQDNTEPWFTGESFEFRNEYKVEMQVDPIVDCQTQCPKGWTQMNDDTRAELFWNRTFGRILSGIKLREDTQRLQQSKEKQIFENYVKDVGSEFKQNIFRHCSEELGITKDESKLKVLSKYIKMIQS